MLANYTITFERNIFAKIASFLLFPYSDKSVGISLVIPICEAAD